MMHDVRPGDLWRVLATTDRTGFVVFGWPGRVWSGFRADGPGLIGDKAKTSAGVNDGEVLFVQ